MSPEDPHALFFHVRIFLGMVVSFALAHLIRELSGILAKPRATRLWWVHLVWVASMFLFLLHFWWWEMRFAQLQDWRFTVYLFLVVYALLLYLLVWLLLPADPGKDYRERFLEQRGWFFGVLALAYLIDFVDTWLKGPLFFESLGTTYLVRNAVYIAASVAAIFTRNTTFHAAFAVAGLAFQVLWIGWMYDRL